MSGFTIAGSESNTEAITSTPQIATLAVIGAGQRGKRYAEYALANPNLCRVVAVAEPRLKTREIFTQRHSIPADRVFADYKDLLVCSTGLLQETRKRIADAVIVAVQDQMHAEVVLECVKQGFDILCEKPMATTPEECIRMADAVERSRCIFGMGHVLRYSPYNHELTSVLRSGKLGELINVVHIEPVGYYHFAHSFVRGNWSNEAKSSFALLAKSCHDFDIICHFLHPATPTRVSSFGSLTHFRKSAKPTEAGDAKRCLDCAYERNCPYSAIRTYLEPVRNGQLGWPASVLTDGPPDIESIGAALKEGPYGKCVYESDNDVVDHQVVNMEFSSGATCSFTMVAFTTLICERQTRMHFSHGEIIGDSRWITVTNFKFPEGHLERTTRIVTEIDEAGGHGGGDFGLMKQFIEAVRGRDQTLLGADVKEVLKSHLLVFAAEKSRKEGRVINVEDYEVEVRQRMEE
ncbi:hypothetical protein FRB94_000957 [Tulasnella sp. JGI-2019a]|nr:hypothetical protein FRB94_000957 [Tulasnella sp. JGI-2019a]KAG9018336.1 hypothetical protein FRB93_000039 [Tulasnella sp. JGI-2019a]